MNQPLIKPIYPFEPITSVSKLCLVLGYEEAVLHNLAANANAMYREVHVQQKDKIRLTFDALNLLKVVQKKINTRILSQVEFPNYLHGSLKRRDYVSNASLHVNQKSLVCEDVKNFFPSIKSSDILDVWECFFHFSKDVAVLLTAMTTKDGAVPQGAPTSSYLANLVFWRHEPQLQAELSTMGIVYSRYVDDISISSSSKMTKEVLTKVIAKTYGMLRKNGFFAARKKHEIFTDSEAMLVTKLLVNRKPSLTKKKRSELRSKIHHAQTLASETKLLDAGTMNHAINKAAQNIGQLSRFHPEQAKKLMVKNQEIINRTISEQVKISVSK